MIGNILAETQWEIARLGKFTSSKCDDLLTEPKSVEAKKRGDLGETAKTYIKSRAAEIITGTTRQLNNWSLEWGNTYEPEAADLLKKSYPEMVYMGKENPVFFKYTDFSGGSPDGWDKENKIIFEIKCPEDPTNHVNYCLLESGEELKKTERGYYHQIQMNMLCAATEFGFDFFEMRGLFASYSPIINEPYIKLFTLPIEPDEAFYEKISKVIPKAEQELANIIWALDTRNAPINKSTSLAVTYDSKLHTAVIENKNENALKF